MVQKAIWKVTVTGAKNSGKSSLISAAVYNSDKPVAPKGFIRKKVQGRINDDEYDIDLLFYETPLELKSDKFISKSTFILLTVDITDANSLKMAGDFVKLFSDSEIFLVAMKSDLRYISQFWIPELDKFYRSYGVSYYLYNTKEDFSPILSELIEKTFNKIYNKNK